MGLQSSIITLIVLLVLSAFFSGSETALSFLNKYRVHHLFEKKVRGSASLKKLKDNPQRMLITILIGNNLVNIAASVMATAVAYQLLESHAVSIVIGIMTLLILVFGEIIPKTMAAKYSEQASLSVAWIILLLSTILYPVVRVIELVIESFSKGKKSQFITGEELETIVRVGKKEGRIREAEMLHRIFRFHDMDVESIMTPRVDMKTISADAKIKDVLRLSAKTNFSRFPVYERSRENIIGIVYIKDIIKKKNPDMPVRKVMGKAYFVPETKNVDELLKGLQKRKKNMAIVVNEHGDIVGLVTIEDAVEEIVGEIMDETEKVEPEIRKTGAGSWLVNGKAEVEDINDKIGSRLAEEDDFITIGGYILNTLGRIPKEGEMIRSGNIIITVTDVKNHRIKKVRIEKRKFGKK